MKPTIGRYYYINYEDKTEPEGSYFGIAKCVDKYERDDKGANLPESMYEFEHPLKDKMVRQLYIEKEIFMEAK
jgi:hypothetical protein